MPERTLAEAVADLRLSDKRLAADFAQIRTRLLTSVRTLESDAKINAHFKINENDIINEFAKLESFATEFAPTTKLILNSDSAVAELASLGDIVDPIVVPLDVDTEQARAQIDSIDQSIGPSLTSAGEEGGKKFGSALASGFRGILGVVGIAAGGFLASSLVAGFQRLTTIEDATASLTVALGSAHDAAVLLDDVLGVVRGTPFNLDQFALAASNMVSFGIEAKKVPAYLTAIGEAAATRGSRANEFAQRLATIFGQITTANRIGGEELLQFSEAGVNALVILANHFKVTTAEMRDMISKGAVPAKESLDVLAEGILHGSNGIAGATNAFAGTMAKLRDTLTGSIGGFSAAKARFGVELIKPFEGFLIAGFQGATKVIDEFGAKARKSLAGIADSDFAKSLVAELKDLPTTVDKVAAAFAKLGPALAPLAGLLGASGLGSLKGLLGPLGSFIPEVLTNPIVAAVAAFALFTPEVRDALLPAVVELGKAFLPLVAVVGKGLGDALTALVPVIKTLIDSFTRLMPLFSSLLNAGVALTAAIVPVFTTLGNVLSIIPIPVIEALIVLFGAMRLFNGVEVSKGFQSFQMGIERANRGWGEMDPEAAAVKARRTMAGLEAAVAGAFAGMALASKNGAAQVTGAIGSISAVALGFATGGPWGGAAAIVGVALGAIVGHFVEAGKEAAAFKAHTDDLATAMAASTTAIIGNSDALALWATTAGAASQAKNQVGSTLLADKDSGDLLKNGLLSLGLTSSGDLGEKNAERVMASFKAHAQDLTGVPEIFHTLTTSWGSLGDELGRAIPQFTSVERLKSQVDQVVNLFNQGKTAIELEAQGFNADVIAFVQGGGVITDAQTETLRGIFDLQKAAGQVDLTDVTRATINKTAADNAMYQQALLLAEAQTGLNHNTAEYTDLLKLNESAMQKVATQQNHLIDLQIREALATAGASQQQIDNLFAEAQMLGINVEDIGLAITDIIGVDAAGGFAKMRVENAAANAEIAKTGEVLNDAAIAAKNLEAAVLLSAAAATRVGVEVDRLKGKLSFRTGVDDFIGDLRNVSEGFSKIINEGDLKKGEGLNKSLADTAERIQKLQVDVNKAADDAAAKAVDLRARIDRARAAGAVGGVALLENELAHVGDAAAKKQEQLDKAIASAHEKSGELSKLGAAPITFLDQLKTQAKELHLSLFDLLFSAPTDEAQQAFEGIISPALKSATDQFLEQANLHPENVKNLGIFYRQVFIDSLTKGPSGLDQETATKLANEFFTPTRAGKAIADQAELTHKKYVAELRKTFENDPDLLTTLLKQLNAPGLPPEARDSIKQSIKDVFQQDQIELGIEPTLVTDTDLATLLGFANGEDVKLAPEITMKATQVNLEAAKLVVNVTAPSKDDLVTTADLTQDQVDQLAAITKQLNVLPPDSPAAEKLTADAQEIIDHAGEVTIKVTPALDTRVLDQQFKDFLQGHGLAAPAGAPLPPKPPKKPGIGIHEGGVFSESHIAQIVSAGSYRVFAEPETHGEAYIPLSPFKRERSMQIMGQIADIFGVDLVPKMDKMPLPSAMTGAGSRVSPSDADLIGRAVARHTKPSAADRANSFAEQFEQGVHFERGAIVIEGAPTPRRTASQLVSRLAELAVRRR